MFYSILKFDIATTKNDESCRKSCRKKNYPDTEIAIVILTLERPGAERSVFIRIHGHSSHKKNRRVSKLRGNVKDQYLRKVQFIQRQKKKFWIETAAIFKSK